MVPKGLSNLCWVECQKVSRSRGAFLTYSPYFSSVGARVADELPANVDRVAVEQSAPRPVTVARPLSS